MKAAALRRVLMRLGYEEIRRTSSHRVLDAPGRQRIVFAFHDAKTVPGGVVRRMLTGEAGLTEQEAREVL